ncbi:hypothetical protein NKH47_12440 [Mesorhizobium sp. M1060]|uniref:hypothetical protein n=1 Tax=unclassified Mesorhizobium TaxID=325217 RepID=UPI0003D02006|nr:MULTISPECIES: hypothetical protein [unclassified Mesorhizobium]ESZ09337.1 hypothetical protein X736_04720 [Mesorhizobium sp. L2C089B000]WJI48394.1 hypothetical protein NLY44_16935 [Mesorhizobium sp. C089B]
MADDSELRRRKALTFEQAEGMEDLPRQLLPEEMPKKLRARLLHTLVRFVEAEMRDTSLTQGLGPHWTSVLRRFYIEHLGRISSKFESNKIRQMDVFETIFTDLSPKQIFGVIQALVRLDGSSSFGAAIAHVLESERSAYRLLEGDTLVPVGSSQEAETIVQALRVSKSSGLAGAHTHLKEAASHLSNGNFADSIREGIHAVESTVRSLTGKDKLSDALEELAKRRPIHGSFKRGIMQLYGFGSDEPGIRHPLLESGDAAVTEEDAMLVLGICASLVTFFSRSFEKPK